MKISSKLSLTEIGIIVVSIVALGAIAYPRFTNNNPTRTAMVTHTGQALSSALSIAHEKWQIMAEEDNFIDVSGSGTNDTIFNTQGWPVGISADGKNKLSEINDKGAVGHDACGQLLSKLLPNQKISIIPAGDTGECRSGDVCARAMANHQCQYTIRATNETLYYDANTGKVNTQPGKKP